MPLKIVKDPTPDDPKKTKVVLVPEKFVMSSRVPPRPRMEHEIDYDMHRVQAALMPVQLKVRPTSKGA